MGPIVGLCWDYFYAILLSTHCIAIVSDALVCV